MNQNWLDYFVAEAIRLLVMTWGLHVIEFCTKFTSLVIAGVNIFLLNVNLTNPVITGVNIIGFCTKFTNPVIASLIKAKQSSFLLTLGKLAQPTGYLTPPRNQRFRLYPLPNPPPREEIFLPSGRIEYQYENL